MLDAQRFVVEMNLDPQPRKTAPLARVGGGRAENVGVLKPKFGEQKGPASLPAPSRNYDGMRLVMVDYFFGCLSFTHSTFSGCLTA
jgi:hypothetical protein